MKFSVPQNLDSRFKPKVRDCGKCKRSFKTTPVRRYMCKPCFLSATKYSLDVPIYRLIQ